MLRNISTFLFASDCYRLLKVQSDAIYINDLLWALIAKSSNDALLFISIYKTGPRPIFDRLCKHIDICGLKSLLYGVCRI